MHKIILVVCCEQKEKETKRILLVDKLQNSCYNIKAVGRERNERTGIGKTAGAARVAR